MTQSPLTTEPFDRAAVLELTAGDMTLLGDLIEIFEEESPKQLAQLEAALARKDASALERAAHTLKGSALNFGAKGAVGIALQLELMGRRRELVGAEEQLTQLQAEVENLRAALTDWSKRLPAESGS
jgi:HPt (histidine-containing phosphotransfer) domain-containing protein